MFKPARLIDILLKFCYAVSMNRNKLPEIDLISHILAYETKPDKIKNFIIEMLTNSELETLSKRWRILEMLLAGKTQREIAKELKVSLCKVTRGAHILKNKNSPVYRYLEKEQQNDFKI